MYIYMPICVSLFIFVYLLQLKINNWNQEY